MDNLEHIRHFSYLTLQLLLDRIPDYKHRIQCINHTHTNCCTKRRILDIVEYHSIQLICNIDRNTRREFSVHISGKIVCKYILERVIKLSSVTASGGNGNAIKLGTVSCKSDRGYVCELDIKYNLTGLLHRIAYFSDYHAKYSAMV